MAVNALLIGLVLAAASQQHVNAQWLTCSTIRRGDTASRVATRITGDPRIRHSATFQIVDPGTGRIVAKSQYDRIQAGWRGCVAQVGGHPREALTRSSFAVDSDARLDGAALAVRATRAAPLLWVGLVAAAVAAWIAFRAYFTERQRTLEVMTRFGDRFVREFERPLIQPVPEARRIRSRLRANPERKRLEILLAPSGNGRYPNLSDHKENVAYDIVRVVQLLRNQSFAPGPPHAEGDWVVVPFQFKGWSKQAGEQ